MVKRASQLSETTHNMSVVQYLNATSKHRATPKDILSQTDHVYGVQQSYGSASILQNAAVTKERLTSLITLANKVIGEFYSSEGIERVAIEVTNDTATNLSRMQFFDDAAIRGLCQVFKANYEIIMASDRPPTLREICSNKTVQSLDVPKLAVAIEALLEAAYFGSGRACQSLIEANELGIYSLSEEEICDLVTAQIEWQRKSLSALNPRDVGNLGGAATVSYPYADQLSQAQCLPDLINRPKAWAAVHANPQLFLNFMQAVYFDSGLACQALIDANEKGNDYNLTPEELRHLVTAQITLYLAARDESSPHYNNEYHIMPTLLRSPKAWEALAADAKTSYDLLLTFYRDLGKELPHATEVAVEVLAKTAEDHPEKFIGYIEDKEAHEKNYSLSPTTHVFTEGRARVLEALFALRHHVFGQDLHEVYTMRPIIAQQNKENQIADKTAIDQWRQKQGQLEKDQKAKIKGTKAAIKELEEIEAKEAAASDIVEFERRGFDKNFTHTNDRKSAQEVREDLTRAQQALDAFNQNPKGSFMKSIETRRKELEEDVRVYQERVDRLNQQKAAYETRKTERETKVKLLTQLQNDANTLLKQVVEIAFDKSMKREQRLTELNALQEEVARIAEAAQSEVTHLSMFVDGIGDFIKSQIREAQNQVVREEQLEALKSKEQNLIKKLVETNPITECIRLAFSAYAQDFVAYGRPTYDWLELIAKSLKEDLITYLQGTFAFKNPGKQKKAREALPVLLAVNARAYMHLLTVFASSGSSKDFWKKEQAALFNKDGQMHASDWKEWIGINGIFPITRKQDESENMLFFLKQTYTVVNYQDPLLTLLNDNRMLALMLSIKQIFSRQAADEVLANAQVTCDRLRKLVNRGIVSPLGNYLKIAMIALGDQQALCDLLLENENNPVWNICLEKNIVFILPEDIKFILEKTLLRDATINQSTIKARIDVLNYLKDLFAEQVTELNFLLKVFEAYMAAQPQASEPARQRYAEWVKATAKSVTLSGEFRVSKATLATSSDVASSLSTPVESSEAYTPIETQPRDTVDTQDETTAAFSFAATKFASEAEKPLVQEEKGEEKQSAQPVPPPPRRRSSETFMPLNGAKAQAASDVEKSLVQEENMEETKSAQPVPPPPPPPPRRSSETFMPLNRAKAQAASDVEKSLVQEENVEETKSAQPVPPPPPPRRSSETVTTVAPTDHTETRSEHTTQIDAKENISSDSLGLPQLARPAMLLAAIQKAGGKLPARTGEIKQTGSKISKPKSLLEQLAENMAFRRGSIAGNNQDSDSDNGFSDDENETQKPAISASQTFFPNASSANAKSSRSRSPSPRRSSESDV